VIGLFLASFIFPTPVDLPGFWTTCLLPGFLALALVGFLDDRISLSVLFRLFVQLAASFYLLACALHSGWISPAWGQGNGLWSVLLWLAVILFMVWMTNLYNFMDGSNGMAAMQGIFVGILLAVLFYLAGDAPASLLAASLAAASLGFLPWNLGQARVFMGDVGSISMGFLVAGLLFFGVIRGDFPVSVAWLVTLVFVCDSSLTLMTRVIRREQWYTPHKQHIYQRLIANGWSHARVMWLYQLINLLLVVPGIVVAVNYPEWSIVVAISTTLALAIAWFLAFRKLERSLKRE
jgi:Fuc2NAc and GlcNAc transferase